jgi:uncharacterized membrane protein
MSSNNKTIEVQQRDKFEPVFIGLIIGLLIGMGFEVIKFLWHALQFDQMLNLDQMFPFVGIWLGAWVSFVVASWFFNPVYKFEKKSKTN